MSRRTSLRPALESLDSLVLLATVVPGVAESRSAPMLVQTEAHSVPATTLNLSGTLHARGTNSLGQIALAGSGQLDPVGSASFSTKIHLANPVPRLVLTTPHGRINLALSDGLLAGIKTAPETFSIVGGTGRYAHATGSGTLSATFGPDQGSHFPVDLHFS